MLSPPAPRPAAASMPSKLKLATRSQPISGALSPEERDKVSSCEDQHGRWQAEHDQCSWAPVPDR
jgi:hypothetical protein